jgi:hypothetical protein
MQNFELLTSFSPWFIPVCMAVGVLYAFLLYQKHPLWNRNVNLGLAALRFIVVSLICFLLLGPFLRQVKNNYEKPTIVLALDNSQSLRLTTDSLRLKSLLTFAGQLQKTLQKADIQTDIQLLDNTQTPDIQKVKFDQPVTNLSGMLNQVQNNYTHRNLAGVVLVSDGIFNQGISPDYLPYRFPVYTVGLGDTVAKRDINLRSLYFNKISYLGNQFPLKAEILHKGFPGTAVNVTLRQNGIVLERKNLTLGRENEVQEVNFTVTATRKGVQRYVMEVSGQAGEFTWQNNFRDAFVEVIEGKEKILMLALSPHPDIKALKYAIEKNRNYEFEYQIIGLGQPKQARYDLVILHQIPDLYNSGLGIARRFLDQKTPVWYILGSQSNTGQTGSFSNLVRINASISQTDQVTPVFNPAFALFQFEPEKAAVFQKFPPVNVPFGDFKLSAGSEIVLYQKVGSVTTDKPLLVLSRDKEQKSAVMLGEGMWAWRQEEFNLTEKNEAFDELILKIVQYLSAKEDKRKLRFTPVSDEFLDTEKAAFEVETYNDVYEKIYNQNIHLEVEDDAGRTLPFDFQNGEGMSKFEPARLPKGVYKFRASARINGRNETAAGEFVVKDLQLESLTTTADHNLLRNLSRKTKGEFFLPDQWEALTQKLTAARPPDLIQSSEELEEIIHYKILFFLLLLLVTAEWGLRKYLGGY